MCTALITGGASGLGRLHALRLADEGYAVALVDIDAQGLEEVSSHADPIHPYPCDVTDLDGVRKTVQAIIETHGPIDRLVC